MRKKTGIRILALLLAVLYLGGCETPAPPPETEPSETTKNEVEQVNYERTGIITDLYTDKARYDPGETPQVTVEMTGAQDQTLELRLRVTQLTQAVFQETRQVTLKAGETVQETVPVTLPETDFQGYSVEVYLYRGETPLDWEMTAAEVASDWSRFPRYGYLTKYGNQTEEEIQATLQRLNKHHITGLFYYDVLNRHEQPLSGTVEAPDPGWKTLANHYASYDTVRKLIDYGHTYNMNSYLYNLIFGAYEDYEVSGVQKEWGLYKDQNHQEQDYHGDFVDSWETRRLYLFDPANPGWQEHYLKVTQDVLSVFHYDGIQVDSLGNRGKRYDYEGNPVDLQENYSSLLNRLTRELRTRVIFNPVSGYGMAAMLRDVDYDIVYEEVWPGDGGSYGNLKSAVDYVRYRTDSPKGIVIAAYMNYHKTGGSFNTPGVLLTDAVLMASGAAHLELGDTGMLKSEYYPGDSLRINDTLAAALRNYYSFMVAYENYLRDPAYQELVTRTYLNDQAAALDASAGRIWSFTKENENKDQVVHFINLTGVASTDWVDDYGKQTAPEPQKDLLVRQYVKEYPSHVYLASPDQSEGILSELSFDTGSDLGGKYVTFRMPELDYWNMVLIRQ